MRSKWCWRNHRAKILPNHQAKNSHEINMNVARFWFFFSVVRCFLALFLSFYSIVFSIAIYDLYVIHSSSVIFSFSLNLFSFHVFLVCDLILVLCHFIQLHVRSLSPHFANGETEMCGSLVHLLVWLNINSCTLLSLEFIFIAWPLSWTDDLAIIFLFHSFNFIPVGEFEHVNNTRRQHETKLSFVFRWYFLFSECR